jgi:hypothetical protein
MRMTLGWIFGKKCKGVNCIEVVTVVGFVDASDKFPVSLRSAE